MGCGADSVSSLHFGCLKNGQECSPVQPQHIGYMTRALFFFIPSKSRVKLFIIIIIIIFQMTRKVEKMKMFFPGMPSSAILNRLWIPRRKSTKLEKGRESQNNKLSEQSVHNNILGFCLHFSQLCLQQYCIVLAIK